MKRSRGNRSKESSPKASNRKQYQPSSIRGLITSRQQSMKTKTQSEVSNYTQKTQRTNTFSQSQDFDNVDDELQKQQMRQVFVSEQQQKVIQKILQIARKGKINQKNAFEIPLKVLDNQNISVGQTKFWKFAAQLLGASINIYEKRIQNTWINTNIIHDKLARMITGKKQQIQGEEVEQSQSRQKQSQFLFMTMEQFRGSDLFDNIRIGQQTLLPASKLQSQNLKQGYANDPLFKRKIKAFDNTSIKGLLLNVFDISGRCEIQLFSEVSRIIPRTYKDIHYNQQFLPNQRAIVQQAIMNRDQRSHKPMFSTIINFKNNIINNENEHKDAVDSIGFMMHENQADIDPIFYEFQLNMASIQPIQSQIQYNQYQHQFQNSENHNFQSKHYSQEPITINSQFHVPTQEKYSQASQRQYSPFQIGSQSPFAFSDGDRPFYSAMTPWEIQFKQSKLRIRSTKKRVKKQSKKRQKVQPGVIQFDPLTIENRKLVLKADKHSRIQLNRKNKNNNLIPPQLAVYEKINYDKMAKSRFPSNKIQSHKEQQNLADFLAPDPSMIINPQNIKNQQNNSEMGNCGEGYHNSQEILMMQQLNGKQNLHLFKYTNIRQAKKLIYEKVKQQRQLRISQVMSQGLTPASLLITFLHIAGQKGMVARNTSEEDDVILSWQ